MKKEKDLFNFERKPRRIHRYSFMKSHTKKLESENVRQTDNNERNLFTPETNEKPERVSISCLL